MCSIANILLYLQYFFRSTVRGRRRPRAVRLPTDPSVVTLARRAHAGTAVPQAPEALTGSPELPSLGDRGTLGRSGHATGGRWTAGGSTIDLVDNRSRSVLIMIIRTDGLPTHSVSAALGRNNLIPGSARPHTYCTSYSQPLAPTH